MRLLFLVLLLSGCATAPKSTNLVESLNQACAVGAQAKSVSGAVMLKAKSKEASGQFPANLEATPEHLKMEVTNLLGGTEAVITVDGPVYQVQSSNKSVRSEKGYGSWGGIPLQWAPTLFMGRIPCPTPEQISQAKTASKLDEGEISLAIPAGVRGAAETFVYRFKGSSVETLHWERQGALAAAVDFKFDDQKWEAKSSKGEVKVRWKDRQTR